MHSIFLDKDIEDVKKIILKSRRPILLSDYNLIKNNILYVKFRNMLMIPELVVNMFDNENDNYLLHMGTPGVYANRAANFIIQNADLILSIGYNFNIKTTGHNVKNFSRFSKRIIISENNGKELKNDIKIDKVLKKDLNIFFETFINTKNIFNNLQFNDWIRYANELKKEFQNECKVKEVLFTDKKGDKKYLPIEYMSPPIDKKMFDKFMLIPKKDLGKGEPYG